MLAKLLKFQLERVVQFKVMETDHQEENFAVNGRTIALELKSLNADQFKKDASGQEESIKELRRLLASGKRKQEDKNKDTAADGLDHVLHQKEVFKETVKMDQRSAHGLDLLSKNQLKDCVFLEQLANMAEENIVATISENAKETNAKLIEKVVNSLDQLTQEHQLLTVTGRESIEDKRREDVAIISIIVLTKSAHHQRNTANLLERQ